MGDKILVIRPGLAGPTRGYWNHGGVESSEVIKFARPRTGHFDLGTGYHGDVWLDLDALFLRPARLRPYVEWLAERLREHSPDAVCGPLEGGAFLAYAVADLLEVAFLAGYRSPGQATGYHLPSVPGGIGGWRVVVVDDAVNAGHGRRGLPAGTARSGRGPGRRGRVAGTGRGERDDPGPPGHPLLSGRHDAEPGLARAGVPAVRRRRPGHAGRGRRPVSATSRSMTGASAPTSAGGSNMPAGVRSTMA